MESGRTFACASDRGAPAVRPGSQAVHAGGQRAGAHRHRSGRGTRRSVADRRGRPHAARRREPVGEEAALGRAAPPAGDAAIVPRLRGAGCGAPRAHGSVRIDRAAGRRTRPGARDRTGAPAPRHGRRGPCGGVPRRRRSGSARDTCRPATHSGSRSVTDPHAARHRARRAARALPPSPGRRAHVRPPRRLGGTRATPPRGAPASPVPGPGSDHTRAGASLACFSAAGAGRGRSFRVRHALRPTRRRFAR